MPDRLSVLSGVVDMAQRNGSTRICAFWRTGPLLEADHVPDQLRAEGRQDRLPAVAPALRPYSQRTSSLYLGVK